MRAMTNEQEWYDDDTIKSSWYVSIGFTQESVKNWFADIKF
jgi:hypothetical protein